MNIIFAIFIDCYAYVRKNNVHTLMHFSTIWNGFEIFILNNVNKVKDFFTNISKKKEKENELLKDKE